MDPMNILVAEDDPIAQHLLCGALRLLGNDVSVARDGTEAWTALNSGVDHGLIILDLTMPGISGLELCRRIRGDANRKPAYIIFLTSDTSRESLLEGLRAGANDFMTKPFDPAELRARVTVACDLIRLHWHWIERAERFERTLQEIKRLEGLLSICAHCRSVRSPNNGWQPLDVFVHENTDAICSHGICPSCAESFKIEVDAHRISTFVS
jgi:DNA-binding response OmpR family regulator